jgi:hypothetical protein
MSNGVNCRRIGFALFAAIAFLPSAVRAKEFVSNPYGFQMTLPPGFREQRADVVNIVAEFIEPQSEAGEVPITIDIRHTGKNYNPADKATIPDLPRQKSSASTSEKRRWKDLELLTIRQEAAVSGSEPFVIYAIVFPLADEGINVVVQGQKSREKEVVRVFDGCVQQFINLKQYVAVTAEGQPAEQVGGIERLISNVLLPVVTGIVVLFFLVRIRKGQSKAASPTAQEAVDPHDVRTSG